MSVNVLSTSSYVKKQTTINLYVTSMIKIPSMHLHPMATHIMHLSLDPKCSLALKHLTNLKRTIDHKMIVDKINFHTIN